MDYSKWFPSLQLCRELSLAMLGDIKLKYYTQFLFQCGQYTKFYRGESGPAVSKIWVSVIQLPKKGLEEENP